MNGSINWIKEILGITEQYPEGVPITNVFLVLVRTHKIPPVYDSDFKKAIIEIAEALKDCGLLYTFEEMKSIKSQGAHLLKLTPKGKKYLKGEYFFEDVPNLDNIAAFPCISQ